jgi:riboflavin synthase
MFTGIISDIGKIIKISGHNELKIEIETAYDLESIALGSSIAHNGICLTVINKRDHRYSVMASAETISCTTIGSWQIGHLINLERALKAGDELGGHYVSGHIDAVADIADSFYENESLRLVVEGPQALSCYIASKGSVALDGVSLTVNEVNDRDNKCFFGVNLIPQTQKATTLGMMKQGHRVNLEIDMMARYIIRHSTIL